MTAIVITSKDAERIAKSFAALVGPKGLTRLRRKAVNSVGADLRRGLLADGPTLFGTSKAALTVRGKAAGPGSDDPGIPVADGPGDPRGEAQSEKPAHREKGRAPVADDQNASHRAPNPLSVFRARGPGVQIVRCRATARTLRRRPADAGADGIRARRGWRIFAPESLAAPGRARFAVASIEGNFRPFRKTEEAVTIAPIETALVDFIRGCLPSAVDVQAGPGDWDPAYVRSLLTDLPAVRIVFDGGEQGPETFVTMKTSWAVFLAVGWKGQPEPSRRQGADGAYAILDVLVPALHGAKLTDPNGKKLTSVDVESIENLWTAALSASRMAVMGSGFPLICHSIRTPPTPRGG